MHLSVSPETQSIDRLSVNSISSLSVLNLAYQLRRIALLAQPSCLFYLAIISHYQYRGPIHRSDGQDTDEIDYIGTCRSANIIACACHPSHDNETNSSYILLDLSLIRQHKDILIDYQIVAKLVESIGCH